ncbi:MAG: YraN family protein [Oscillospiraceae bacterium]|nr:YraN family protein [Oscillospiraceae bacterium]
MRGVREELKSRLGACGEQAAALWLELRGFKIAARNFNCRFGEIDIVAEKDGYICFVEVKTRAKDAPVSGAEAVDARKQKRLRAAAEFYLQKKPSSLQPRFDLVLVEREGESFTVTDCIENAFGE